MANNCGYDMKVVAERPEDLDEFLSMMTYSHPEEKYFARIFEAYPYNEHEEDGKYVMYISGDCAWSVYSCMCSGPFTYYDDNAKNGSKITNLAIETKRLKLKVEIFSEEPGVGFAEHIIFDNGKQLLMEETDLAEYWNNDELPVEEFEAEYNLELTEEQKDLLIENGYVTVGGYDIGFTI